MNFSYQFCVGCAVIVSGEGTSVCTKSPVCMSSLCFQVENFNIKSKDQGLCFVLRRKADKHMILTPVYSDLFEFEAKK